MTPELAEKLAEIHRLLIEAYDHYFEHSDGHCKSSEAVVSLTWPTYWELKDGNYEPSVEIYSYVLGPYRNNYFKNIDEALAAVREWHKQEMSSTYEW